MSDFAKPFANGVETLEQASTQSQTLVQDGEHATEQWLTTHTMLAIGMIPLLQSWLTHLRAAMKPVTLLPVYIQRYWLKRYIGVTWWHPNGLRLRAQIGCLWLLIQYERLCDWLLALYRACVRWCSAHRRQLLWGAVAMGVILMAYLWLQVMIFIWGRLIDGIYSYWEFIFGP